MAPQEVRNRAGLGRCGPVDFGWADEGADDIVEPPRAPRGRGAQACAPLQRQRHAGGQPPRRSRTSYVRPLDPPAPARPPRISKPRRALACDSPSGVVIGRISVARAPSANRLARDRLAVPPLAGPVVR